MRTSELDYDLPAGLIAQKPVTPRDSSRLLVVDRASGTILHKQFTDLPDYLRAGDLLVMNDTRVIPARLFGRRHPTDGQVELLFHSYRADGSIEALTRPAKRLNVGQEIRFAGGKARATVVEDKGEGLKVLKIRSEAKELFSEKQIFRFLKEFGQTALPPYVHSKPTAAITRRYQTVYAEKEGATAAPTAGLHFTRRLFRKLYSNRIQTAHVTLHTGLGTFRPIMTESVDDHRMHSEWFEIPGSTATAISRAKSAGRRVVAVGTTTVRTLEHAARSGTLGSGTGHADLFIQPGHDFQIVDALLTNFHLPRTTLLALVMAFSGKEIIRAAYAEAVRNKYRFFSFGDAMLIV